MAEDEPVPRNRMFTLRYNAWRLIVSGAMEFATTTAVITAAIMTFSIFGVATAAPILVVAFTYSGLTAASNAFGARYMAGHTNPVITAMVWFNGFLSIPEVIVLFAAQAGASFTGAAIALGLLSGSGLGGRLGTPLPAIPNGIAFANEAVLPILFFYGILWGLYSFTTDDNGEPEKVAGPMVIKQRGYKIAIISFFTFFPTVLVGAFLTGGLFNPARYLGGAVISGAIDGMWWIYLVAPWVGGAAAALAFWLFFSDPIRLFERGEQVLGRFDSPQKRLSGRRRRRSARKVELESLTSFDE